MSIYRIAIKVAGIDFLRISILCIFVTIACFSSSAQDVYATPPIKKPPKHIKIPHKTYNPYMRYNKKSSAKAAKAIRRRSFSKNNRKESSHKLKKRRKAGNDYLTNEIIKKTLTNNSQFFDSLSINIDRTPRFIVDSTLLKSLSPRSVPNRHIHFSSITDSLRIKQGVIL